MNDENHKPVAGALWRLLFRAMDPEGTLAFSRSAGLARSRCSKADTVAGPHGSTSLALPGFDGDWISRIFIHLDDMRSWVGRGVNHFLKEVLRGLLPFGPEQKADGLARGIQHAVGRFVFPFHLDVRLILSAKSSRCQCRKSRVTGFGVPDASEPVHHPFDVHGRCRGHMLQARFR